MKNLLRALASTAVAILAVLLLLEVVLQFLPVNSGLGTQPVNQADPILHFKPDRDVTWSRFPDFSMRNQAHVNNYGFVSDLDYAPDDPRPLVAVIGDSYVEAAMSPWKETVQGRLDAALEPRARVYSFGASGAPLSQYLAYAGWAARTFAPQRMVFVIVGNDFDESLLKYKSDPGFHYFSGPELDLVRQDFEPNRLAKLLCRSSLVRYLAFHLRIQEALGNLLGGNGQEDYVGQTSAQAGQERLKDSCRAVDAFLDRLPTASGLEPEDVLFLVDGPRDPDALEQARGSYTDRMRDYFMDRAKRMGFRVQDMQTRFMAGFTLRGERFEYPRNGHWNGLAHGVAFQAVMDSGLLDGLVP